LEEGRRTPFPHKTIHGDLHLGQIFVDPDSPLTITGVLDIDTAGTGDPADDAAALYGHLEVLTRHLESSGRSDAALRTRQLGAVWRDLWRRDDDPGFRHRALAITATHLMGHALRQSTDAAAIALLRRAEEVVAHHA